MTPMTIATVATAFSLCPLAGSAAPVTMLTGETIFDERCTGDDLGAPGGDGARNCEWSVGELRGGNGATNDNQARSVTVRTLSADAGGDAAINAKFAVRNGAGVAFTLGHIVTSANSMVSMGHGAMPAEDVAAPAYAEPVTGDADMRPIRVRALARARARAQAIAPLPDRVYSTVASEVMLSNEVGGLSMDIAQLLIDSGEILDGEITITGADTAAADLVIWDFDFLMAWSLTGFNAFGWVNRAVSSTVIVSASNRT